MNIQTAVNTTKKSPAPRKAPKQDVSTEEPGLTARDVVTRAAYTSGGALGGSTVGVVTGLALSSVTGSDLFARYGGGMGAVTGAVTGFAASKDGVSKETLARSVGSWVGSSLGSTAGMWAVGGIGRAAAANGASAILATHGALLGTVAGGLVGAAIPFAGAEGRAPEALKASASIAAGGTAGTLIGAGVQCLGRSFVGETLGAEQLQTLSASAPQASIVLAPLPVLFGAAAALKGADLYFNDPSGRSKPGLRTAQNTTVAGLAGYMGGAVVGGVLDALGGSPVYSVATPIVGATVAGLSAFGLHSGKPDGENLAFKGAKAVTLTALGAGIGDHIGRGLTALTGHGIYTQIGAVAGAANGLAAGLRWAEIDDKKALPVLNGALGGGVGGAVLGTGLAALSGQPIWKVAIPALGALTGGLTGLALSMSKEGKAKGERFR